MPLFIDKINPDHDKSGTIMGWGCTSSKDVTTNIGTGFSSDSLNFMEVNIQKTEICKITYKHVRFAHSHFCGVGIGDNRTTTLVITLKILSGLEAAELAHLIKSASPNYNYFFTGTCKKSYTDFCVTYSLSFTEFEMEFFLFLFLPFENSRGSLKESNTEKNVFL